MTILVAIRKNAFGYWEFPSEAEYKEHMEYVKELERISDKNIKDYNSLVDEYNRLKKEHASLKKSSDKAFSDQLGRGAELQKQVKSLLAENQELAKEIEILKTKALNDYEVELQNCKTVDEVTACKLKHKAIMNHRKMRKMVEARGETHDF